MAFVYLSEKTNPHNNLFPRAPTEFFFSTNLPKPPSDVPPLGLYDPQTSSMKVQQSNSVALNPVPFGSNATRVKVDLLQRSFQPGPGQYTVKDNFSKPDVFKDLYEPGCYYIIEDNGIKRKIQGYLEDNEINRIFGTNRKATKDSYFSELGKIKSEIPGPGQYEAQTSQKRYGSISGGSLIPRARSNSSQRLRELVLKEYKLIKQEQGQVVGPASYTPQEVDPVKIQKGPGWGQSKVARKTIFDKESQPEVEVPFNLREHKKQEMLQLGLKKSHSLSQIVSKYPRSQPTIKREFIDQENADEFLESDDDKVPGPGQYHNENQQTAFRPVFKSVEHQFFGSSTERFKASAVSSYSALLVDPLSKQLTPKQLRDNPMVKLGPGSYNHEKQQERENFYLQKSSSFQGPKKTVNQFQGNSNPAPGQYNSFKSKFELLVEMQQRDAATISREKKFFHLSKDQVPGPGSYTKSNRKPIYNPEFMQSIFKSKTPRINYQNSASINEEKQDGLEQKFNASLILDAQIEKKKEKIKKIYLDQAKKGKGVNHNASMISKSIQKTEDSPGQELQGQTKKQFLERILKDHAQSINRMNNNFQEIKRLPKPSFSKSLRFSVPQKNLTQRDSNQDESTDKSLLPGPGQYNPTKQWNKKSFNQRFNNE